MSLADQIIDHGPYAQDYLIGPGFAGPLGWLRAADLNALRDELLKLRQRRTADETLERLEVEACAWAYGGADLTITCKRCEWTEQYDFPDEGSHDLNTLAELVRRATQHAEVCR